ncbi:MAG: hypothetical protein K2K37_12175 [Muribaculaceae bacterium]|nr:hypothetical protein [Muribaculaceae bacterium]
MKKILLALAACFCTVAMNARTLVAYYSYTNNVESIVNTLASLIDCDVLEIEPAEKGLDYAANNYAIGSAQIAAIRNNPEVASSYPEIDPVVVNLEEYTTIIVAAPLWWSQMAAPMQTFLFKYGAQMAGKNIGLIVSSASSGISGVEADANRLIPDGKFLSSSLWIRSSQTSNAKSLIETWLNEIEYEALASIRSVQPDGNNELAIYTLSGIYMRKSCSGFSDLSSGMYIINGKKTLVIR